MFSDKDLKIIRSTILEAGAAILEIYNSDQMDVEKKTDNSPVTAADLAADKIIYEALKAQFPSELIVTEERASSHKIDAKSFFIIDPLDGTKEFIHKRGDFTVNIGYVKDGIPEFGMVYAPAKSRLFYTKDGKAYEEIAPFNMESPGKVEPIQVAQSDMSGLKIVASKSHRDAATDEYIQQYNVAEFQSAGSSLKFCLVATGEADFYPRLGPTMEWDTAAADAVVRAAGGKVLDFERKEPLQYGKPEFRNGFFLVTSADLKLI